MESPHGSKTAYWDHEPRIGAFPGAEVGRLESRPSEQWFMESLRYSPRFMERRLE